MPPNGRIFRVVERQITNVLCHADGELGVVKVQMPEQCDNNGLFFKIRDCERERNLEIVCNTIAAFGCWAQRVNAPAIILFPELSVGEQATDWLQAEMATASIAPNTLIVLGMEQLTLERFSQRASNSQSTTEFNGYVFGPNVDRVNTAVILVKDKAGSVSCFYQPKCSRSDYESPSQYTSDVVYKFAFGQHHFIVCICSDFFLQTDARPLVGSVMLDIDRLHPNSREHRIDLVLLIQKNRSPLNDLYHDSVKYLFYNRPHQIVTSDTIVCTVNSANSNEPGKYSRSNVSVMRRGRPPLEYKKKQAFPHFAWCSHRGSASHLNDDLHYARWRLRSPGAISFILSTHPRPWPPGNLESLPVCRPGLHRLTERNQFEPICPIPEVYELQEVLYRDFYTFIDAKFGVPHLRCHYKQVAVYESLLDSLVARSPHEIIDLLLVLQDTSVNCDHWDMDLLVDVFRHFLVALRLLSERYSGLGVVNGRLHAESHNFGIVDCNQKSTFAILEDLADPQTIPRDIDMLLLQRISELFPWDGVPTNLEELQNRVSMSRAPDTTRSPGSVAAAPSPWIADLGTIINRLNRDYGVRNDGGRVLNEILRFV